MWEIKSSAALASRLAGMTLLILGANVGVTAAADKPQAVLERVDHLVYAVPRLEDGIDRLDKLLGVRAVPGGRHPGFGTHNALIALGPRCYLEIIAPDPSRKMKPLLPFGMDALHGPKLVAWAVTGVKLDQTVKAARSRGVPLGDAISGTRQRADGTVLTWQFTNPRIVLGDGLVPFFIDWQGAPHPAAGAPTGLKLIGLRAEHTDPERVQAMLDALEIELHVMRGPEPRLTAIIEGPRGRVELY
jgi:hypothetical protein